MLRPKLYQCFYRVHDVVKGVLRKQGIDYDKPVAIVEEGAIEVV